MFINYKSLNVNQWIMHTMVFSTVYDVENIYKMTDEHIFGQRHWKVTESAADILQNLATFRKCQDHREEQM